MMVRHGVQPLTGEQLIKAVEDNQSQVMFFDQHQSIERLLRDDATYNYKNALHNYPPIYLLDRYNVHKHSTLPD